MFNWPFGILQINIISIWIPSGTGRVFMIWLPKRSLWDVTLAFTLKLALAWVGRSIWETVF